jgi:hypothetical protein
MTGLQRLHQLMIAYEMDVNLRRVTSISDVSQKAAIAVLTRELGTMMDRTLSGRVNLNPAINTPEEILMANLTATINGMTDMHVAHKSNPMNSEWTRVSIIEKTLNQLYEFKPVLQYYIDQKENTK